MNSHDCIPGHRFSPGIQVSLVKGSFFLLGQKAIVHCGLPNWCGCSCSKPNDSHLQQKRTVSQYTTSSMTTVIQCDDWPMLQKPEN